MSPSLWIAIACVGIVLVAFCFASPVHRLLCLINPWSDRARWSATPADYKHVYRDEDGEAADDPEEQPRGQPRLASFLILAFALGALVVSALDLGLFGLDDRSAWILGGWVVVNIDVAFLLRERYLPRRFGIGLLVALSSLALSFALGAARFSDSQAGRNEINSWRRVIYWVGLALGVCLAWTCCSLPRRPDVYSDGQVVDGQFTCSATARSTFAWVRPLLDRARKERRLEYVDLPALDHTMRSQQLQARFPIDKVRYDSSRPLWRTIVAENSGIMTVQWAVAVLESIVNMVPPIFLYQILSLLENRAARSASPDSDEGSAIWLWIFGLAVSALVNVAVSRWSRWVSFGLFAIPVRSQLSAVIFAKSMRMKTIQGVESKETKSTDVVDAPQEEEDEAAQETDRLLPQEPNAKGEKKDSTTAKKEPEDVIAKGIVNLLGVDVPRVTLAGFAVPILFEPANRMAGKYYTSKQLVVMSARDNKAHVVTEALQGVRQIKFSATEVQWEKRIMAVREKEIHAQRQVYIAGIFLTFAWIAMPALIGAAALSVYAWLSGHMIASVAFTALSIFSNLERAISSLPTAITEMIDARVSAKRIHEHLASEERPSISTPGTCVEFSDASVTWPSSSTSPPEFELRHLNLRFPNNELSVISGKTGTGKSLLLAAIIGEADLTAGEIQTPQELPTIPRDDRNASDDNWIISTAMAFVSQVPWIENLSVKDAILFGLPYRQDRYQQVLYACALLDDIRILPDGEDTEVGATGINLSGGQRWRLSFARALYSRAGILVLDDIFSAVDSHVGWHLLHRGILGPLGANRTKILVTHHLGLVDRYATYLVKLNVNGTTEVVEKNADETQDSISNPIHRHDGHLSPDAAESKDITDAKAGDLSIKQPRKFVEDESREHGRVKWNVYKAYITTSGGLKYWILTVLLFALGATATLARSYWLALWTETYTVTQSSPEDSGQASRQHLVFYLCVYLGISLASISLVAINITLVVLASLRSARYLFQTMTLKVLRAQLRWLDTEPTGRILNRFVGDFALIDAQLGGHMTWSFTAIFSAATIVIAAIFVSAWMLIPIVILSLLCIYIAYLYLDATRDFKRLESTAKSPVFELIGSALLGLSTIRCFDRTDAYLARMYKHIDRHAQTSWHVLLSAQWMAVRQGVVGALFATCVAVGVASFDGIDASLAGFALSFALNFSGEVQVLIQRYTSTELAMNSTERVLEYTNLETEPLAGDAPAPGWPSRGDITVHDLEVGYAKHLDSVLRGISFSVRSCERIGIVGRTGSGKSSLTLAMFRFLEARRGSIEIDGVDISTLNLHALRSALAIIPQDPVLFSGTLRSNLDPFDQHSDVELLEALERVDPTDRDVILERRASSSSRTTVPRRRHRASILPRRLASPIARGGTNLSQGQKQLVCLARALVTQSRVLVLDEATSAVDMETDALIQRSIREEFRATTLLVVAHRLSTVADFDKILVMSEGRVVEFDRPEVLAKSRGAFWKMVNESGEKDALQHLL